MRKLEEKVENQKNGKGKKKVEKKSSEGSEGTMSCLRVPGEKTTQDVTVTSWMTCAQQSFHGSIQTATRMKCQ